MTWDDVYSLMLQSYKTASENKYRRESLALDTRKLDENKDLKTKAMYVDYLNNFDPGYQGRDKPLSYKNFIDEFNDITTTAKNLTDKEKEELKSRDPELYKNLYGNVQRAAKKPPTINPAYTFTPDPMKTNLENKTAEAIIKAKASAEQLSNDINLMAKGTRPPMFPAGQVDPRMLYLQRPGQ